VSWRLQLWQALPANGFAAPLARNFSEYERNAYSDLHKRSLLSEWKAIDLIWHKQRTRDKLSGIYTLYSLGALCFPTCWSRLLLPASTANVEFLPLRLGDDDWCLLNCLRSAAHLDRASSDLWIQSMSDLVPNDPQYAGMEPWIAEIRWANLIEPEALAEQWDVLCVPASSDPMAHRHLLLTDVFVDRVRSLGLRGLDFKHVGYIVPDASQVVAKPPAPPPPPPKSSKRKAPKLTTGPLPADEQIEISEIHAEWRQRLQLPSDANPATVLARLAEEMQKLRPVFLTISAEERADASLGLSAIFGELLCSACGWSWVELRESRSKRWIAVLSPTRNHALALVPYVQQQIQSAAPNVTLLFNMIVAGNLPPAEPGQLVTVG
jgi:hypothetical protein